MNKKFIRILAAASLLTVFMSQIASAAIYSYTMLPTNFPATLSQGAAPIPVTITVTNTSGFSFGLGAPTVGSDSNWKELTNSCNVKVGLANGASCVITGLYTPKIVSSKSVVYLNTTVAGNMSSHRPLFNTVITKNKLIVVGSGPSDLDRQWSNARILTSSDEGATWNAQIYDDAKSLSKVIANRTQFLAFGEKGTILSSPEGSNWSVQNIGATKDLIAGFWDNSRYLVYDVDTEDRTSNLLTSADGISWTSTPTSPPAYMASVLKRNNTYVGVGINANLQTLFLTSTNGSVWTENYNFTTGLGMTVVPGQLIWTGSQYVMVGLTYDGASTFSGIIYTSPDGTTWTGHSSGTSNALISINWNGTQYVAVGSLGTILTSPDANTWTARQSNVIGTLNKITWDGSRYIAVGDGTIITSPDAITWTTIEKGTSTNLHSVAWDGANRYVAVGGGVNSDLKVVIYNSIVTSTDGVNWTQATTLPIHFQLNSVVYGNGVFVAVGLKGTILKSTDGLHWSQITPVTQHNLNSVTWSSNYNKFFAVGNQGVLLYSSDGTTWTTINLETTNDLKSIVENRGRCVAVGTDATSSSTTITSADCNTDWATSSISGVVAFNKVIADGNNFVAVGTNGRVYSTSDGTNWQSHTFPVSSIDLNSILKFGNEYIVGGQWGVMYRGNSLDSWTVINSSNKLDVNDLMVAGSKVIFVGSWGVIFSSPDGATWSKTNIFNLDLKDILS